MPTALTQPVTLARAHSLSLFPHPWKGKSPPELLAQLVLRSRRGRSLCTAPCVVGSEYPGAQAQGFPWAISLLTVRRSN